MAPERPRMLVVLDLADVASGTGGTVYHWDPVNADDAELVVLWEAKGCPTDFVEAPEGVVCVAVPPGYREFRYELVPPEAHADGLVQSWRGQLKGSSGLMLVAILPP